MNFGVLLILGHSELFRDHELLYNAALIGNDAHLINTAFKLGGIDVEHVHLVLVHMSVEQRCNQHACSIIEVHVYPHGLQDIESDLSEVLSRVRHNVRHLNVAAVLRRVFVRLYVLVMMANTILQFATAMGDAGLADKVTVFVTVVAITY